MDYQKYLKEIDSIMNSIEKNNDIDKQIELYEKGKKKCDVLEKKINDKKETIQKLGCNFTENKINLLECDKDNKNKDIKSILKELEVIYNKLNSEEMSIDDIEEFYKQSLILKKKSEDFCKQKNLKIDIV